MRAVKSPIGFIKKAVSYIVSLVFPESCIFCLKPVERNSPNPYVCRECLEDIPYLTFDERLKETDGVSFEGYEIYGLSIYDYRSIRDTIFLFKYKGFKRYGSVLGRMMADYVIENKLQAILDADMVVPVPLWKEKEKKRGFNQAALMAESFSEITGIPYDESAIMRIRDTAPQNSLRKHQRDVNIRSAFKVTDENKVKGRKILLLDDIYTTGSTVRECAKNFYADGAKAVMYIALAGADEHDD